MINRIKTIYYNTVAFNASAVAIGYTLFSTMLAVVKLSGNLHPLGWGFRGPGRSKRHFEMDIQ